MKFDIAVDTEAVGVFVRRTIDEFFKDEGKATVVKFDVQAVHGQIHAYPSTKHSPDTIYEDIGKPVKFCFDRDSWSDHYWEGDHPDYNGRNFDPDGGDAGFNDYISVMVYDATISALAGMPDERLPDAVIVESAGESGGVFHKLITPKPNV